MDKQDEIFYVISFYKKNEGTYFVSEDIEGNLYKTKFRSKSKIFKDKEEPRKFLKGKGFKFNKSYNIEVF